MLTGSATISDSIVTSDVYEHWSQVENPSRSQVVAEVCACVNRAVDCRREVKDSRDQWYAVGCVKISSEDVASWSGVKIFNTIEEGHLEHVRVSAPSVRGPGPSSLRAASGKAKMKKVKRSPVRLPRCFEFASPLEFPRKKTAVEDSRFSVALDRELSDEKSQRIGQNLKAAAVFQRRMPF